MDNPLQLLVFLLEGRSYGLHLHQVQRVVRAVDVVPLPDSPAIVQGVIDLQGTLVPLFNVRRRFGVTEREIIPDDQFVIATTSRQTVALAVDRVTDIIHRPNEQVIAGTKILDRLSLVQGALQIEDGLVLIHNLDSFLSLDEQVVLERALVRQAA